MRNYTSDAATWLALGVAFILDFFWKEGVRAVICAHLGFLGLWLGIFIISLHFFGRKDYGEGGWTRVRLLGMMSGEEGVCCSRFCD